MKNIGKSILIITALFVVLILTGCTAAKIIIPDIISTDEDTAKNTITGLGLIPVIQEMYSDVIGEGLVAKTSPATGVQVEKTTKVTIYISKGPKIIYSNSSTISWYNISSSVADQYDFYAPYIDDGVLKIEMQATINTSEDVELRGFGTASISDTFDKTVPVSYSYDNAIVTKGETQNITLSIPIKDLDVQKPTTIYVVLPIYVNGEDQSIYLTFTMSW